MRWGGERECAEGVQREAKGNVDKVGKRKEMWIIGGTIKGMWIRWGEEGRE